jgi:hypothetical protein
VANFGDTPDDNDLEVVMESIRWNAFVDHPPLEVDLEVEAGMPYRLQLLFAEGLWDRGFDISVEGERVVEAFNIQVAQGGYWPDNEDRAVVYSLDLVAADELLNISFGSVDLNAPDNNPLLHALTLELLPGSPLKGDYNNNGELDAGDLDMQAEQIVEDPGDPAFDLNGDNVVDFKDRQVWINDLAVTWMGDANLNCVFDSSDQVQKFVQGKYEKDVVAGWADGDSNGDMRFNSSDMVADFAAGGYELAAKEGCVVAPAVNAVPEPSSSILSLVALAAWTACCRRARRR